MSHYDPSMDYGRYPTFGSISEKSTPFYLKCSTCGSHDFLIRLPEWIAVCKNCSISLKIPFSGDVSDTVPVQPDDQLPYSDFQIVDCPSEKSLYRSVVILRPDGTLRVEYGIAKSLHQIVDWKRIVAIDAGRNHIVGLRADGTVTAAGLKYDEMEQLLSWSNIVAISASAKGVVGLRSNGTVCAVGVSSGTLAQLEKWTNIDAITSSGNCIAAIRTDGTVRTIGSISNEVYGWENVKAISLNGSRIIGLHKDGSVSTAGYSMVVCQTIEKWKDITAIESIGDMIVAICGNHVQYLTFDALGFDFRPKEHRLDWTEIESIYRSTYNRAIIARRKDGFIHSADPSLQRFIVENMD